MNTYKHVGQMIAVSLIYGGPPPGFFAPSVANYIIHGITKVKAAVSEIPSYEISKKLLKVC